MAIMIGEFEIDWPSSVVDHIFSYGQILNFDVMLGFGHGVVSIKTLH